uniref:Fibronectin type-III domain-containing protein n=1 Tax=Glossina brevipalpis TaxID=37001 RepID=A0A1A9W0H1_9MUSC
MLTGKNPKVVWYRLTDAPEWRTMRILQKNVMEATIQHLLPGREYEFMVLSQDKHGDGMFSKQIRFSTQPSKGQIFLMISYHSCHFALVIASKVIVEDESAIAGEKNQNHPQQPQQQHQQQQESTAGRNIKAPPAPPPPNANSLSEPWNLSAINNQQGWLLHWEHPVDGLDLLRHYTVRWWKEPEHHLVGTVETFDNYYQLRHLKEGATFKIQVLALSMDGEQIPSSVLMIQVPSHRKARILLIGSSVGVAFLLCALIAFLYVKRSCLFHLFAGGINDVNGGDGAACSTSIDDGDDSEHSHDIEKINNT